MDFRLAPDVNRVLKSFFLDSFWTFGPRVGTHSNFMTLLVFLVMFWSFLFLLFLFCRYSVALLVSVLLLCPFSVKMSIKKVYFTPEVLFSIYFVCLWMKAFEYSHCDMRRYVWIWFYLHICYWCFPKDFEIIRVITSVCDIYIINRDVIKTVRLSNLSKWLIKYRLRDSAFSS